MCICVYECVTLYGKTEGGGGGKDTRTAGGLVEVIIRLQVQFGMNLHEQVFQKVSKFYELAGRVKFEPYEKLTSAN